MVVDDPVYGHLFDTPRRRAIARAGELATTVIEESWSGGDPQIVHGDLHEWNVHLSGSNLHAFDFEDVMWALPAQDVAISLYHTRSSDQRTSILESFKRGYESVLPWPIEDESQLDGFQAARQVMLMNYAARALPPREASDYLDRVFPWLMSYLERYDG